MSKRNTDGDEQYLREHCWADRHGVWPLSLWWDDCPRTCYIIIIVEAVSVQVTGLLLNSIRADSSFIGRLSDGICWPLPETALITRLTKNNTTPQKGDSQLHKGKRVRKSTAAGVRTWSQWLTWTISLYFSFFIYKIKVEGEFIMSHLAIRCLSLCVKY